MSRNACSQCNIWCPDSVVDVYSWIFTANLLLREITAMYFRRIESTSDPHEVVLVCLFWIPFTQLDELWSPVCKNFSPSSFPVVLHLLIRASIGIEALIHGDIFTVHLPVIIVSCGVELCSFYFSVCVVFRRTEWICCNIALEGQICHRVARETLVTSSCLNILHKSTMNTFLRSFELKTNPLWSIVVLNHSIFYSEIGGSVNRD